MTCLVAMTLAVRLRQSNFCALNPYNQNFDGFLPRCWLQFEGFASVLLVAGYYVIPEDLVWTSMNPRWVRVELRIRLCLYSGTSNLDGITNCSESITNNFTIILVGRNVQIFGKHCSFHKHHKYRSMSIGVITLIYAARISPPLTEDRAFDGIYIIRIYALVTFS